MARAAAPALLPVGCSSNKSIFRLFALLLHPPPGSVTHPAAMEISSKAEELHLHLDPGAATSSVAKFPCAHLEQLYQIPSQKFLRKLWC